ncbi:uncharacterized protein LOC130993837 [Salvia miltiorrhiza]|uniref:uncharacterized protein LOC130993837 n=1 Tax=Salvia miltiorrhiza TaxID=226208 RepID=UPI0025AC61B3|nr:uncharacterized protein LOC130993837 [Salvia miltiorrhiza]
MNTKARQKNMFVRIISSPYRALCRARDLYVRSMLDCASSNAIGLQSSSQGGTLPRSFSVASSRSHHDDDADYRELVRAASARSIGGSGVDLHAYLKQERKAKAGPRALPPRSISVAMGRIDEDRPIGYFGEDIKIGNNNFNHTIVDKKNEFKYPRSKSHAVARTSF